MDGTPLGMRRDMEGPGRIVVVCADVGTGPDTAAVELARRLRGRGFVVDRLGLADVLPRPLARAAGRSSRGIGRWLPRGYVMLLALTNRSRLAVSVLRALLRPVRHGMRRAIPADTRAVVTTDPFANQLLGPLRRQGRLVVPLITYVTDFVVRPVWLAPGVDVYCAVRHAELSPAALTGRARGGPAAGNDSGSLGHLVRVDPADPRTGPADPGNDPAGVVAEAARRAGSAGVEERCRPTLVDSVGDAVAVVAALLQSVGGAK